MNPKSAANAPLDAPARSFKACTRYGRVHSVYDGDTIKVITKLHKGEPWALYSLRISDIDTPELRGPQREAGIAVRDAMCLMLPKGCTVQLTFHKVDEDKFGRLLGSVRRCKWTNHFLGLKRYALADSVGVQLLALQLALPFDGKGKKIEWTAKQLAAALSSAQAYVDAAGGDSRAE